MKKAARIKTIAIILGCFCLIAAATLYIYNYETEKKAARDAEELVNTLSAMLDANALPEGEGEGSDPALEQDIADESPQNTTVKVGNYDICGVIAAPSVDIKLAVINEWSYPNLRITACRFYGSPGGQMMIMAHNFETHFGRIKELVIGDSVTFTDANGKVYEYTVIRTETVATDQLKEITSGRDWNLTLFTCTYGGANRVVVRCALV